MKITRLYADANGESHFEDIEIALADKGAVGMLSETMHATGVIFRETSGDYDYSWHNAPRRQYVIMLEGSVEIEISDGTKRRFGPGEVLLTEDTSGRGHCSRTIGNEPRKSIFVPLE